MMKTITKGMVLLALFGSALNLNAETTADMENFILSSGSYLMGPVVGTDTTLTSGNAEFGHSYSSYWSAGWTCSNVQDSTTEGYSNLAASRAGSGYNASANYLVGQNGSGIALTGDAKGKEVAGVYITNGTYAARSMENGDTFAKKFGGADGNDQDWFKLTIKAYLDGVLRPDSVDFYLADFRSSDNSQDSIVESWNWVDLTSLGNCDSLSFHLSSSDVGQWGMNTPAFFCLDNLVTADSPTSSFEIEAGTVSIYPNPVSDQLTVEGITSGASYSVVDLDGSLVLSGKLEVNSILDLSGLSSGVYTISIQENDSIQQSKLVKL